MDLTIAFQNINWLSVVVATVAAFAVGGLWYSPLLFSKTWVREGKLSETELKNANMLLIFGGTFLLQFVSAVFLDIFIGPGGTIRYGIFVSAVVSIAWIATAFGTSYLFSRRTIKLYLIDAGYFIAYFLVMGIILGAW
jgi:hypothetical protein